MKNNAARRIAGVILAVSLLFYTTIPAFAAGEKEEVVYVKLSHDGRVDTIYVVNGFDLPQGGTITDRGNYSEVRNLTTTDAVTLTSNTVSVSAPQGKFYYEGVLETRDIPWDISVEYLLDGKPISGDKLAGESGRLQIDLHIHHNPAANPVYTDNYAIQASLSLDGERCVNIEAEDATIASVGKDKQLSYIILPGKEGDFTITADVVDFEMDGISINGIPLSLNIDDPDTEEIKDKIAELQDGAIELDDGAWELDDGARELNDGAVELDEGATKLDDGVLSLEDGLAELDEGVEELQEGADDLRDGAHELYNGTKDLRDGVTELEDGVSKLDSGAYTFGQGLSMLGQQSPVLVEGSSAIYQGLQQINDGLAAVDAEQLDTVSQQVQALANGSDQYLASLDAMIVEYEAQLSMLRSSSRSAGSENTLPIVTEDEALQQEDDPISNCDAMLPDGTVTQEENTENSSDEETADSDMEDSTADEQDADNSEEDSTDSDLEELETEDIYYHMVATPAQASTYSLGASRSSADADMIDFLEVTIQNLKMMRQSYLEIHAGIEGMESFTTAMGEALPTVSAGIGEITEQYGVLDQAVNAYTQGVAALDSSYSALTAGISDLVDGVEELMDGAKELRSGARELYDGTYDLQDGVDRLTDGAAELRDGATELRDGTIDMKDGTLELLDGTLELLDGTLELLDGTTELRDKTADMDQEIDDKIDELLDEYRGSDFDAVSFVDARNNVSSVQFVMLTDSISIDETVAEVVIETEPAVLTLWQRFLNLFSFLWK